MMRIKQTALIAALLAPVSLPALADAQPPPHSDATPRQATPRGGAESNCISDFRAFAAAANASVVTLTKEQWEFMRGVYVINPETPPGLPFGDGAAMMKVEGRREALIVFLDGNATCVTPMVGPGVMVDMIIKSGEGEITHFGDGT